MIHIDSITYLHGVSGTYYFNNFQGWSELTLRKLWVVPRRSSPLTDNMDLSAWLITSRIDTNHAVPRATT